VVSTYRVERKKGRTERVILSAGAMLIFSVSFQIDQMPEGEDQTKNFIYIGRLNCGEAIWLGEPVRENQAPSGP
jgi:hypothetical protein